MRRNERGGSESVSAVVIAPMMVLFLLAIWQTGVWYGGREAALSAAQAAAEAERVLQPAAGAGQAAANSIAQQRGLLDVNVSVSRGAETVTVVVTARVPMIVEGFGRFTEHSTYPRERVTR